MKFTIPSDAPAQVRSWNTDYMDACAKGNSKLASVMAKKISKYLAAVSLNGGKTIKPPRTKVEIAIEVKKNKPAYTKLTFGRMY